MLSPFHKTLSRAVPLCFLLGAGIELFMIRVRIGQETFCLCLSGFILQNAE